MFHVKKNSEERKIIKEYIKYKPQIKLKILKKYNRSKEKKNTINSLERMECFMIYFMVPSGFIIFETRQKTTADVSNQNVHRREQQFVIMR